MREVQAYPARPKNEYGWGKLCFERVLLAHGRNKGMNVRIPRVQNCCGLEGTWMGRREKAPAALCCKVAAAEDGGAIEIWGDGTAVRAYTYVDDMVDGIRLLVQSDLEGPANIGSSEYLTVSELVAAVAGVAHKNIHAISIPGPVGVQSRNFSNERIYSTGWRVKHSLQEGISLTYPWVETQVRSRVGR